MSPGQDTRAGCRVDHVTDGDGTDATLAAPTDAFASEYRTESNNLSDRGQLRRVVDQVTAGGDFLFGTIGADVGDRVLVNSHLHVGRSTVDDQPAHDIHRRCAGWVLALAESILDESDRQLERGVVERSELVIDRQPRKVSAGDRVIGPALHLQAESIGYVGAIHFRGNGDVMRRRSV